MFLSKHEVKKHLYKDKAEVLPIKDVFGVHGSNQIEGYMDEYAALSFRIYGKKDDQYSSGYLKEKEWCKSDVIFEAKSDLCVEAWYKNVSRDNHSTTYEIALVFRGTQSAADFVWGNFVILADLFGLAQEKNYYRQVERKIHTYISEVKTDITNKVNEKISFEVSATGHSLGGGLAQFAAYCNSEIKNVFAFNSSWITFYTRIAGDKKKWKENCVDTHIARVWETGEILWVFREITEFFYLFDKSPNKDPQFIEYKVNLTSWTPNPISAHAIKTIYKELASLKTCQKT